jgi:hypothetical protein
MLEEAGPQTREQLQAAGGGKEQVRAGRWEHDPDGVNLDGEAYGGRESGILGGTWQGEREPPLDRAAVFIADGGLSTVGKAADADRSHARVEEGGDRSNVCFPGVAARETHV